MEIKQHASEPQMSQTKIKKEIKNTWTQIKIEINTKTYKNGRAVQQGSLQLHWEKKKSAHYIEEKNGVQINNKFNTARK